MADITEKSVMARYLRRGEASKARADLAARVLRAVFNYGKGAYEDAKGASLFPRNPTDTLGETCFRYKIECRRTIVTNISAWCEAVQNLNNPVAREYLEFLPLTGCRKDEAAILRREYVDLRTGNFQFTDTKNRRAVTLPLLSYVKPLWRGRKRSKVFAVITLPIIAPALVSGWLLVFTLSLDDLVIASFVSKPSASTLPMLIFSEVRLGLSPEINAPATVFIAVVALGIVAAGVAQRRGSGRG